jgi:hypothetical protein
MNKYNKITNRNQAKYVYVRKRPPTGLRRWVRARKIGGAWQAPNYRKNVQCLGNGRSSRWIDLNYVGESADGILTLSTFFSNSLEFGVLATNYRYMRINKLSLCIYPQEHNLITRWLMKWTDDAGNLGIDFDDSSKIVQTHTTKNQFLKWKPINAILPTNKSAGLVTTNLKDWIVIDDLKQGENYYVPGSILYTISNLGENKLNFRLSVHVSFAGSKTPGLSKLQELMKKIEIIKTKTKIDEIKPIIPYRDTEVVSSDVDENEEH